MIKYTIKRILLAILTAFIIISLTFILIKMIPFSKPGTTNKPGAFAYYINQVSLGYVLDFKVATVGYGELLWSYQDTAYIWHYFYARPIMDQYINWFVNIFTKWDWGTSTYISPNVGAMIIIVKQLPYTIGVNLFSVIIAIPLGVLLGVFAALKKNTVTDHVISTLVMVFISIPSFIIISFLMLFFCYNLKWLPSQWPADSAPTGLKILGYIIPVVSLSFGSVCGYTRFTRAELCEVMSSDYLLLARTKGLTKSQTVIRHALRNAMVPIVPNILAEFIGILSGSMILEQLYGIPGIGKLYITAISSKDYNVLLVDMALFTIIGLIAGVVVDLSYGFIDPRIRMGAKK